jgi:hypothetical protein
MGSKEADVPRNVIPPHQNTKNKLVGTEGRCEASIWTLRRTQRTQVPFRLKMDLFYFFCVTLYTRSALLQGRMYDDPHLK